MRVITRLIMSAALLLGWVAAVQAGAQDGPLTGSFWYAFDNISRVEPGARILVWVTVPPAWHGQTVRIKDIEPKPVARIADQVSGNTIIEWLLEPEPYVMAPTQQPRHFFFHYDFEVTPQPVHVVVDGVDGRQYDRDGELYRRYTRQETWLQTDGIILDRARSITAGLESPVDRARALFDWIIGNLEFVVGGSGPRDARSILEARAGDCEQFSLLFTAMCRSLGIPARTATNVWPNGTSHVFAEVLLPDGRWLPVELSVGQLMLPGAGGMSPESAGKFIADLGLPLGDPDYMFGNLYDRRVVITVGNNIAFMSPTLGTELVFQRMRPGGDAATPAALKVEGLGEDVVQGGFYVLGEQPRSRAEVQDLVHLKLADRFFAADRYDVVEAGCRASLDAEPDAVQAWLNMGRVYMHKQDYYRAEAAFKRALEGGGGNPREQLAAKIWTHNYLGNCYDLLGHRDLAVKEYQQVVDMGNNLRGAVDYAARYLKHPYDELPTRVGAR